MQEDGGRMTGKSKSRTRKLTLISILWAVGLVVIATISVVKLSSTSSPGAGRTLDVPTSGGVSPMSSGTTVLTGELIGHRIGDHACFYVRGTGTVGSAGDSLLIFTSGHGATLSLTLLGPAGKVIAKPGDTVTMDIASPQMSGLPGEVEGCRVGSGDIPVFQIRRT